MTTTETQVRERPILFSGEMVCAILEGRKTQTRRVVKPQPPAEAENWMFAADGSGEVKFFSAVPDMPIALALTGWMRSPHGVPGDRLWVRETHAIVPRTAYRASEGVQQTLRPNDDHDAAVYAADWDRSRPGRWRPSIHMPRWACRIELEVTDVRVARLQGISGEDAIAEGCVVGEWEDGRALYADLWDKLNSPRGYGWAANPWVWVINFRRVDQ